MQAKINDAFGTGMGGAVVSTENGKLVITARMGESDKGSNTSLSCGVADSSFLKEIGTTRTAAQWSSKYALSSDPIVIDGITDEFSFNYKHSSGAIETVTLKLSHGTYDKNSLVAEINKQLGNQNNDVKASVATDGKLVLTSGEKGSNVSISYGTTTGGSSSNVIFGSLQEKTPANALVNLKTEDTINIDNATNQFTITVNGVKQTVTLDNGSYNRDSFVAMLNPKLNAIGVEAYVSGDKIGYRTLADGNTQSLLISYADSENSMRAIYGQKVIVYPPVTASFTPEGYLKLDTDPTTNLSVSSNSGAGLQVSKEEKNAVATSSGTGYTSNKHASIDGVNLKTDGTDAMGNPTIKINEWNNNLEFTFVDNGTSVNKSATIADGTYTYDTLRDALVAQLDPSGTKLNIMVDATGVKIETVGVGINNRLLNPSGDFYNKVMCQCTEITQSQGVTNKLGTQNVTKAFTVGREDISSGVIIRDGISDTLTIDFEHDGVVDTIEMKLAPGEYSGSGIRDEIQRKLNEQLVLLGFEENLIEVGLGNINTGVVGANDDKALNFSLSKTVKAPTEGSYIIDGVGGNAAFEVFYKTDGEMLPAFVRGSKNIGGGLQIKDNENELHLKVDDDEYDITIEPGFYTSEMMINKLNQKFEDVGAPLVATLDDGRVKVSHEKIGKHKIHEISGSARDDIFFREYGEEKPNVGVNIQLSAERDDNVEIPRTKMTTTLLGINSICISRVKYATKAVDRISEAISKVSDLRSAFGTSQNKLEHAINSNKNKAENTTAAESRIRDTDMATMMMEQAKQNIIQQAGEAMLAQANTSNDGILALLG